MQPEKEVNAAAASGNKGATAHQSAAVTEPVATDKNASTKGAEVNGSTGDDRKGCVSGGGGDSVALDKGITRTATETGQEDKNMGGGGAPPVTANVDEAQIICAGAPYASSFGDGGGNDDTGPGAPGDGNQSNSMGGGEGGSGHGGGDDSDKSMHEGVLQLLNHDDVRAFFLVRLDGSDCVVAKNPDWSDDWTIEKVSASAVVNNCFFPSRTLKKDLKCLQKSFNTSNLFQVWRYFEVWGIQRNYPISSYTPASSWRRGCHTYKI